MKAANKQFQIRKGLAQVRHTQILKNNFFLGCSLFIFAYTELWQARATLWLWHMGSRVWTQSSWCTGLVAPWPVGSYSSQTRERTHVPCTGRQVLNHWTTRELPFITFQKSYLMKKSSQLRHFTMKNQGTGKIGYNKTSHEVGFMYI